jgi:putative flavoprotein involved in K+ transport
VDGHHRPTRRALGRGRGSLPCPSSPSLQLVGAPERRTLSLNTVAEQGVQLVAGLSAAEGTVPNAPDSFANLCTSADFEQQRLLHRLDEYAAERGLDAEIGPTERLEPTSAAGRRSTSICAPSARSSGRRASGPPTRGSTIRSSTVRGRLTNDGGVLSVPGMYVLGLPFMRRRKSSFLDGVGPDSAELATHLEATAIAWV